MAAASGGVARPDGAALMLVSRLVSEARLRMNGDGACYAWPVPSSIPGAFGGTTSVSSPPSAQPCGTSAGGMTCENETMPGPRVRLGCGLEERPTEAAIPHAAHPHPWQ
jgi:hypothetical protein